MSEEDDKRYGLPPLPVVKFIGLEEAKKLNNNYKRRRKNYRKKHPIAPKID